MPGGWTSIGWNVGGAGFQASEAGWNPSILSLSVLLWSLDAQNPCVRLVNGTERLIDRSRSGTARQMQPGRCYVFNGTSDHVDGSKVTGGESALSFCAWIRTGNGASNQWIGGEYDASGNNRSWAIHSSSTGSGRLTVDISGDGTSGNRKSYQSTASVADDAWHHVAFTWASGTLKLYIDGVEASVTKILDASFTTTHDHATTLIAGAIYASSPVGFWNGEIFDFRIYKSTLSDADIADIAAMAPGSVNIGPTGATVWYKCDEGGTYATAIDSSGNGNDGTITAAAIGTLQDEALNDIFSFQNELGYTDDTGSSGALLPRDESAPTLDTGAGALEFSGQAPHDPILSSPCATLDGVADKISRAEVVAGGTELTLTAWIKVSGTLDVIAGEFQVSGGNQSFLWLVEGTGKLQFTASSTGSANANVKSTGTVNDGAWHHVAVSYNAGSVKHYIDGVASGTGTTTGHLSLYDSSAPFTMGSYDADVFPFAGGLADVRVFSEEKSQAEISAIMTGTVDGTNLLASYPICEGAGTTAYDVSGNGKHGTVTTASEANFWANTQDKTDTLTTDGAIWTTEFDGSSDWFDSSTKVLEGPSSFSASAWVRTTNTATDMGVVGQWQGSTGNREWLLNFNNGVVEAIMSTDGSSTAKATGTNLADGQWHHIAMTWDGATLELYEDGVSVDTQAVASVHDGTCDFAIGALNTAVTAVNKFSGGISQVVVEEANWSATTVAAIRDGTIPASAWYWTYGNESESQQGFADLTINGAPQRINIPLGSGPPSNVSDCLLLSGQSLDLGGGEANSPYAQQLADLLADLTYDQADDDEADALFARVNSEGDDRIIVTIPALAGDDLTNMQEYTT